jgi:hypothetical protein
MLEFLMPLRALCLLEHFCFHGVAINNLLFKHFKAKGAGIDDLPSVMGKHFINIV